MKLIKLFLSVIFVFLSSLAFAQYTIQVGGEIELSAPASRDSKKPNLYDVKWRYVGTGSVTFVSDTSNPTRVIGTSAGSGTLTCSARYYNKAKWTDLGR